jgi:hypothetical protein
MKRIMLIFTVLTLMLLAAALPVSAESYSFSGTISASNPLPNGRLADNGNTCSSLSIPGFYYDLIEFTPASSGNYYYVDVGYISNDPTYIDGWMAIYTGSAATFDPSNPAGNGCFANYDDYGVISLTGGVTYTIMVSTYGSGITGNYLFYLNSTPFSFSGTITAGTPITGGRWNNDTIGCTSQTGASSHYYITTTFTPDLSGFYAYVDGYNFMGTMDSYLGIFNGPFDPANPLVNCIANFDDDGLIWLDAGVTYTLVLSTYADGSTGNVTILLIGPGSGITAANCPRPLPAGSVVYPVPAGAPTFWAPDLATQTDLILPAGTWWISEFEGDFAKVWIACQAEPVWIPSNAVAR